MADTALEERPSLMWPYLLPRCPLLNGSSGAKPNPTLRTSVDAGPARARRYSYANFSRITAAYSLNKEQLDILWEFGDISAGAFFCWPDHLNRGYLVAGRIKPSAEGELFSYTPLTPNLFSISLIVEVVPHITFKTEWWPWP